MGGFAEIPDVQDRLSISLVSVFASSSLAFSAASKDAVSSSAARLIPGTSPPSSY